MKIILAMHLAYLPVLGGAAKCNRLLAEDLARRGHTISVIVPAVATASEYSYAQFREALTVNGVQVESTPDADVFNLNGVEVHACLDPSRLRAYLENRIGHTAPDLVLVSNEDWSQGLLETATRAAPGRAVYIVHTLLYLPFGPQAFFPSRKRTALVEKAIGIIAVGHFVRDYIHQWSELDATVLHWPAYGSGPFPDLACFDSGLITLVNPSTGKGLPVFQALAQSLPDLQFAAVPTWGTTDQDRHLLQRLPNVRLLEPDEDFERILAQTRVLLMPSLWQEAFPLTVVEAMLRGIPVLAADTGGLPEAKLGTDGVLPVQPIEHFSEDLDANMIPKPLIPAQRDSDLRQWCDALRALVSNRERYEQQSKQARAAATQFVSGLSFTHFEEYLADLANRVHSADTPAQTDRNRTSPAQAEPNGALAGKLSQLTPEQRALLMQWLKRDN
jgi:glycosyltransferase involved in cell wall biosynthesis